MKVLSAELVASVPDPRRLPPPGLPEIAVLGRSNVGKSSLLNALVGRKRLARTSATPGKTRLLHFYRVRLSGGELLLVDLPGYGYARVSQAERGRWKGLVEGYLGGRPSLRAALLLQDVRRDLSEDEHLLLAWLAERDVPAVVALTKADKLPPMRRGERARRLAAEVGDGARAVVPVSALKGSGIRELWRELLALIGSGA